EAVVRAGDTADRESRGVVFTGCQYDGSRRRAEQKFVRLTRRAVRRAEDDSREESRQRKSSFCLPIAARGVRLPSPRHNRQEGDRLPLSTQMTAARERRPPLSIFAGSCREILNMRRAKVENPAGDSRSR